jgi:hypothetical protein
MAHDSTGSIEPDYTNPSTEFDSNLAISCASAVGRKRGRAAMSGSGVTLCVTANSADQPAVDQVAAAQNFTAATSIAPASAHVARATALYPCDLSGCGKTFTSQAKLDTHRKRHIAAAHECLWEGCGKSFNRAGGSGEDADCSPLSRRLLR